MDVIRCKNCKHRPHYEDDGYIYPPKDDNRWIDESCPHVCGDHTYSEMPEDDWFCNFGESNEL